MRGAACSKRAAEGTAVFGQSAKAEIARNEQNDDDEADEPDDSIHESAQFAKLSRLAPCSKTESIAQAHLNSVR
jgi:hypothetical protein